VELQKICDAFETLQLYAPVLVFRVYVGVVSETLIRENTDCSL